MKKQNLHSRPPKIIKDLEAFINGAEVKNSKSLDSPNSNQILNDKSNKIFIQEAETFPWEEPQVREDVKKTFTLRLSEPDLLKLQFIQKKTNKSMHKFCLEHLIPAIEAEINKLKTWHL